MYKVYKSFVGDPSYFITLDNMVISHIRGEDGILLTQEDWHIIHTSNSRYALEPTTSNVGGYIVKKCEAPYPGEVNNEIGKYNNITYITNNL